MTETFVILVATTTGLTEAIKRAFGLNKRYIPLVSVFFGVTQTALFVGTTPEILLSGVIVSLTACGLYSSTKATLDK